MYASRSCCAAAESTRLSKRLLAAYPCGQQPRCLMKAEELFGVVAMYFREHFPHWTSQRPSERWPQYREPDREPARTVGSVRQHDGQRSEQCLLPSPRAEPVAPRWHYPECPHYLIVSWRFGSCSVEAHGWLHRTGTSCGRRKLVYKKPEPQKCLWMCSSYLLHNTGARAMLRTDN